MRKEFAILAIGLMLAAAFSGCIGGEKASSVGAVKVEGKNVTIGSIPVKIVGKNSTGIVFEDVIIDAISEKITADNRDKPEARQKTLPEFTFAINISKPESISKCEWNFGDGQTGTGLEAKCTFNTPGQYLVKANITAGGMTFEMNITAAVNYHASGQDSVSGVPCLDQTKTVGDEYWDYLFHVAVGAKKVILRTLGDPSATSPIPTVPTPVATVGGNDIELGLYSPKGAFIAESDSGNPGTDEKVEVKKVKEAGNYDAKIGCYDLNPTGAHAHTFTNTGSVAYFFFIDVMYV
ncbi:MAG: PKD domain-containing protein [Candidatus Thermoplasmatota archaeon]|nr:PKD domain-containing protein [Candidatus Thermoplasmatota archaeon]